MKDDTVVALRQPESFSDDPLTEILRAGARQLLGQAIEAEVAAHIEAHADLTDASGRRRIVRHGHMPEREVQTGIGAVTVKRPRVRDRDPQATGGRIRFTSSILPPYLRRAKSVEALLPWLYLKGISSGDFSEALAALLGPDAPGLDDGWGWIFTAVEHWNAECVGWHVCKRGDRFAALQPISMGLAGLYGSTAAGAARGLALRMDHGSQYLSDHFTNQIKFWGIQPSYAFVAEPQTNGVAERFNRTLKEQIIHGRIYRNIAELRDAVRDFVELYNAQWIVEKNGYLSPAQARQAWHAAISIRPAA